MPGKQTELLKQLFAVNEKIVLLVLTGGPISMTWEAANLPAIMVCQQEKIAWTVLRTRLQSIDSASSLLLCWYRCILHAGDVVRRSNDG